MTHLVFQIKIRQDLDFSEIDFDGLSADQKEQAIKMLREESDSFAKADDDIGAAPDLTLDIKLSDQTPVQKSYLCIPRPLYGEVKNYIEDLLNKTSLQNHRHLIHPEYSTYTDKISASETPIEFALLSF